LDRPIGLLLNEEFFKKKEAMSEGFMLTYGERRSGRYSYHEPKLRDFQ
jgi:hypothetical protein